MVVTKSDPPEALGFFADDRYAGYTFPKSFREDPRYAENFTDDLDDSHVDAPTADPSTELPADAADQAVATDDDPPTDPAMPVAQTDHGAPAEDLVSDFDPFAPFAFQPEAPWYRSTRAMIAVGAIGAAAVAMLVAAVLLVAGGGGGADRSGTVTPLPSSTTSPPSTTPVTSEPPPPPPPPPVSPPPSAGIQNTYVPQYPRQSQGSRPNVTTPQTRPPEISVRPTHRPAFPNQPGGG